MFYHIISQSYSWNISIINFLYYYIIYFNENEII